MASTLCCITRSMPAMPMAESRPPMVVGIRHTSSETRTAMRGHLAAAGRAGRYKARTVASVATASRKISVRPGDQDIQRDFVRRLLALRAFDQRDHAIQEGFAWVGGDS